MADLERSESIATANGASSRIRFSMVCEELFTAQCLSATLESQKGFEADKYVHGPKFEHRPEELSEADLVFIDSGIGRRRALDMTQRIQPGPAKVVILGVEDSWQDIAEFVEQGIAAYVPRGASLGDFVRISRLASEGQTCCSPPVMFEMFERLSELSRRNSTSGWIRSVQLTTRELDILRLLSADLSNDEIATRLYLSVPTVKNHVHRILSKLGVRSRMEAVACWADARRDMPYGQGGLDLF